jgi:hypothetical protein
MKANKRGGFMPQNPYLDNAMIENNSENENENENEQNQTQQTQNQTQQNQQQNQAIEQLNQQLQEMQINNNLEPIHQIDSIATIPEEQNMPQYVNNSQISQQGGKRRKSYKKKNRKTRRRVRKSYKGKRY